MRPMHLITGSVTCIAGMAWGQTAKPPLQMLETGIRVEPVRVAQAVFENGKVEQVGEWIDYFSPGRGVRCVGERIFECFGDGDEDGRPDDPGACGQGEARWFFGTGYCNSFVTNDFEATIFSSDGVLRMDTAWYWGCESADLRCVVGIWTDNSDANSCQEESWFYSGWLFDFGPLECNPAGYYYANLDIRDVGRWPLPSDGRGSYVVAYLTDLGYTLAPCAQPMLWGAPNNFGGDPNAWGAQGPMQWDDDSPADGNHEGSECHDYTLGVCPDPLGAMLQMWQPVIDYEPCWYWDITRDGLVDSRDVIAFIQLWIAEDRLADCNCDDAIDSRDIVCFLRGWVWCR